MIQPLLINDEIGEVENPRKADSGLVRFGLSGLSGLLGFRRRFRRHAPEKFTHSARAENNPIVVTFKMDVDYFFSRNRIRHQEGNAR